MSMSDRGQDSDWQLWQPESLLESFEPPVVASPQTMTPPGDPLTDVQFQAELARLRQQAEREGYAAGERSGLQEGQNKGYREGFSQGKKEGLEQGVTEATTQQQALVSRFTRLIDEFQSALDSLDSAIPARLVQLSMNAVRSMLGSQIVCDPTVLLEKITHLLQESFHFTNHLELWVSEEDFHLVQQHLGDVLEGHRWTLRADGNMAPGGCRLTAEEGELDATLSTSWQMLCNLSKEDYYS